MRTVFRFSKYGPVRYISHLDLMRAMNRAIRRAGVDARYSQGFHPHILLSFAQALGVGYCSRAEYMEIELAEGADPGAAMVAIGGVLPEGLRLTGAWRLDDAAPTLMAAVAASRWLVELPGGADAAMVERFTGLLAMQSVEVVKDGKHGKALTDIRPGLMEITPVDGGVELLLAAGSRRNIRPELVVRAALGDGCAADITRLELYIETESGYAPLYQICSDGE